MSYRTLISIMPKAPAYDADAQAFFTAAGITDSTQKTATNQLVLDLKSYSIWTKMKAIYPFVGGTSTTHSYNLANTSNYQISWSGGITHNSNGVTFNGINGYGNTNLSPNSVLNNLSNHISVYNRNSSNNNGYNGVGSPNWFILGTFGSNFEYFPNGSAAIIFTPTGGTFNKMIIGTRRANNDNELYENGISKITDTTIQALNLPSNNFYIGAVNNAGSSAFYSNQNMAMFTLGDGLTDTESSNLYTAVQAFKTTLGRQV